MLPKEPQRWICKIKTNDDEQYLISILKFQNLFFGKIKILVAGDGFLSELLLNMLLNIVFLNILNLFIL